MPSYTAENYDDEGNLKAPWWFWLVLLYLLQYWALTIVGMAMQSSEISNLVIGWGWGGFLPGVCALWVGVTYPLRGRWKGVCHSGYILLIVGSVIILGNDIVEGWFAYKNGDMRMWLWASRGCFSLACLLSVAGSRRLRCVYWLSN
ncbi:DUF2919 family protein [Citrobacter meridianamericanus]|uniref:DUF2919 family protein n=1 Tax=Citrobacter meridianamericanus TaxID=2894201 RepID=UPI0039BDC49E